MTNLVRFDSEGIELVINTDNGEAFATQAGYARMSGLTRQTINKRVQGCHLEEIKIAEIHTPGGLQRCNLISAKLILKWLVKDNPELAIAMGEAGATMYLHQLAGYKVSSTAIEPVKSASPLELAQSMLDALKKQETELAKLNELAAIQEEINQETQERLDGIEAEQERLVYPGGRYYTAMGYANLKGIKLSLSEAIRIGKLASEFCRQNQIEINRVSDTKFGKINSYPESVLSELITEE